MKKRFGVTLRSFLIGKSLNLTLLVFFSATFFLAGCGGGGSENAGTGGGAGSGNQEVIIPATTRVLDESTLQQLSSISDDGRVYTFDQATAALTAVSPGDVIVSAVTSSTPYGLLRKVASVSQIGGQMVVHTENATIADAIQKGVIEANYDLIADDIQNAVALQRGVFWQRSLDDPDEPLVLETINLVLCG